MKKTLVLTLLATACVMAPVAHATTLEEETGATAEGRTAGGYASNGNFNTSAPAAPAIKTPAVNVPAAIEPAAGSLNSSLNVFGTDLKAQPGECYGKVTIPAVKKTTSEQLLVAPAGKKIAKIIPAQYKNVTETRVSQEASEELITIPATYKTVTETVTVKPAGKRVIRVPAEYKTVSERVLVKPATSVWKQGEGANQRYDAHTGEILCLVEVPAEYKTISKRVLVSPETTREETIPAVTKQVTKRVVDQAARVERRPIPAVTKQITKRVLVTPEQAVYEDVPAKYSTVNKEVLVSPEKVTWSRILCKTNTDTNTVSQIQSSLKKAGYNPGRVDGVLGGDTYRAVNAFQRDNNLNRGEITYETLKALGLSAS